MAKLFVTERKIRFSHCDPAGIVYFVNFFDMVSGVVEDWLRSTASRAAEKSIDDATAAYYASLRGEARVEDNAISTAMSRAATDVVYDAPRPRRARKQR